MDKSKIAANVIEFNRDVDFYLDMADSLIDKGQYISALSPIRRACKIDDGFDAEMRLAELYFLMEQYEASALIYYKLLVKDHNLSDCYYYLGQNYYYLNELDACFRNLNIYMTLNPESDGVFDAEDLISEFEIENYIDGYKLVYPVENSDFSELMQAGRGLITSGEYLKAAKIYEKVSDKSEYYILARNSLTLCYILEKDYVEAYNLAKTAVNLDANNIFSLCNIIVVCFYLNKTSECDKYLIRLLNVETENLAELYKIANTLCEIRNHENVYPYLNRILKYKPYDITILQLSAIAAYNCKHFDEALHKLKMVAKIDENDVLSEYLIKFITAVVKEKDVEKGCFQALDYSLQFPFGEVSERVKKIKSLKTMKKEHIKKLYEIDASFQALIKWTYKLNRPDTVAGIMKRLIECGINLDDKISDIMLSVSHNLDLKKEIVKMKVFEGDKQEIAYSFEGALKFLKPQYPKNYKEYLKEFKTAYSTAFSILAFATDCFEGTVLKTFKEIYLKLKNTEKLNAKAIAAVIAYKTSPQIFPNKKQLCRVFGANITVYNQYSSMLN